MITWCYNDPDIFNGHVSRLLLHINSTATALASTFSSEMGSSMDLYGALVGTIGLLDCWPKLLINQFWVTSFMFFWTYSEYVGGNSLHIISQCDQENKAHKHLNGLKPQLQSSPQNVLKGDRNPFAYILKHKHRSLWLCGVCVNVCVILCPLFFAYVKKRHVFTSNKGEVPSLNADPLAAV